MKKKRSQPKKEKIAPALSSNAPASLLVAPKKSDNYSQAPEKDITVPEVISSNKNSLEAKTNNSEISLLKDNTEFQISYRRCENQWSCQFEAIAGTSHRNKFPPLPCQDAATSAKLPKPFVIVTDGAGSSPMSDMGAQAVVMALSRLLSTLKQEVINLLDDENQTESQGHRFALTLVRHARGVLIDLAQTQRRPMKDFRCTLLLAIVGKANLLWLKVGDGALVQEKMRSLSSGKVESELQTLGVVGKGDFANETIFIDETLRPEDVQSGFLPAENVCGLAAMSDGAALALVSHDGTKVAPRLATWLNDLREGKLRKSVLTTSFYDPDFSRRAMGDDCSISLVASTFTED